jgi:amino acid transporter
MFVSGWGLEGAATGVESQFAGEVASAWYALTDRFVGTGLTTIFEAPPSPAPSPARWAFFNTSARYLYVLGRERVLPSSLARTHPTHHSPYIAAMAVAGFVALYCLGFVIDDSSTEGRDGFHAWKTLIAPIVGTLAMFGARSSCSLSASSPPCTFVRGTRSAITESAGLRTTRSWGTIR